MCFVWSAHNKIDKKISVIKIIEKKLTIKRIKVNRSTRIGEENMMINFCYVGVLFFDTDSTKNTKRMTK